MPDQSESAADVPHNDQLELLAGYADDDLSSEDRARVEAHLQDMLADFRARVAKDLPSAVGRA